MQTDLIHVMIEFGQALLIINIIRTNERPKGTFTATRIATANRITRSTECYYPYGISATGLNDQVPCSQWKRIDVLGSSVKSIVLPALEDCIKLVLKCTAESS